MSGTSYTKDQSLVQDQETVKRQNKAGYNHGIANTNISEITPNIESSPSEVTQQGKNNSFIIQGRDRPGNLYSGYGGKGSTSAGRVDIIAGLSSGFRSPQGKYGTPDSQNILNPNFAIDASRVYISQKSDIDAYMGLASGERDKSTAKASVAVKSDTIRMHGRGDVKIVSGRGKFEGTGPEGERFSHGGVNEVPGGISLVAGNYTQDEKFKLINMFDAKNPVNGIRKKLQSVPKGENLVVCLNDIMTKLSELASMIDENTDSIASLNFGLRGHMHTAPTGPTSMPLNHFGFSSINKNVRNNKRDKITFQKNVNLMKVHHLNEAYGNNYVNSRLVKTT